MNTLKRILRLIPKADHGQLVWLMLLMIIASLLEMIGIGLIAPFFKLLQDPEIIKDYPYIHEKVLMLPLWIQEHLVIAVACLLISFYALKNLFILVVTYLQSRFLSLYNGHLCKDIYVNFLKRPISSNKGESSDILNRKISFDALYFTYNYLRPLLAIINDGLLALAIIALLVIFYPMITLATAIFFVVSAAIVYLPIRNYLKTLGTNMQFHRGAIMLWINQTVGAYKEIRTTKKIPFFTNKINYHLCANAHYRTYETTLSQLPRLFLESLTVIGVLILVIIQVQQGIELKNMLTTFAVLGMAAFRLLPLFNRLATHMSLYRTHHYTLDTIEKSVQNSEKTTQSTYIKHEPEAKFAVQFKDISFNYHEDLQPILDKVNLNVPHKSITCIIGQSGSGKSTLVDILMGLKQPQEGQIILSENTRMAYIPQQTYILASSIRENVAFGIQEDDIDDTRIWEALKQAKADEFIKALPQKLETVLEENGSNLSGGQRQRIGIARALYHKPNLLVMDEATSALDMATEKDICKTLGSISKDITILLITHRTAVLEQADTVYDLSQSKPTK